jgi:hypothetical protein
MAQTGTQRHKSGRQQRGGKRGKNPIQESLRDSGREESLAQRRDSGGGKFTPLSSFQSRQHNDKLRKLLTQDLSLLTVLIYGPRLPGATDFRDDGGRAPFSGEKIQPIELTGNIFAGDIIFDMLSFGLVLVDIKFKDQGGGRNYLYFRHQDHLRPNDRELLYSGPTIQELVGALAQRNFYKNEIYINENPKGETGTKQTIKFYPTGKGIKAGGGLVKPMWITKGGGQNGEPPTHAWELKPVEVKP